MGYLQNLSCLCSFPQTGILGANQLALLKANLFTHLSAASFLSGLFILKYYHVFTFSLSIFLTVYGVLSRGAKDCWDAGLLLNLLRLTLRLKELKLM